MMRRGLRAGDGVPGDCMLAGEAAPEIARITIGDARAWTPFRRVVHGSLRGLAHGVLGAAAFFVCMTPIAGYLLLREFLRLPPPEEPTVAWAFWDRIAMYLLAMGGFCCTPMAFLWAADRFYPWLMAQSFRYRVARQRGGGASSFPVQIVFDPRVAPERAQAHDPWDDIGVLRLESSGLHYDGDAVTIEAPRAACMGLAFGHNLDSPFSADTHAVLVLRTANGPEPVRFAALTPHAASSLLNRRQCELLAVLEDSLGLHAQPLG